MSEQEQKEIEKTEDITIDFQSIAKKTFSWIQNNYIIFIVLIPIILSIFIRIQPVYLPILDDSAEQNVYNSIKASIEQAVNSQYPNLPDANKQALVMEQLNEIYASGYIDYSGQQVAIDDLVQENANQLKSQFQDEYGLTYLGEIDPWYFYRLTENYLDHGYEGDIEIDGRYYDDHQLAGTPRKNLGGTTESLPHFHVTVEVYLYKFISLFIPNIRLMTVVYLLPVLLATLSVVPAFFLVKRIAGSIGGLVASILVAVHPAFVGRTIAGFSDTDGYNILFPLFIMWLFIESIENKSQKKAIALAVGAGILVGLFSKAWGGWWYIFDFLLGVCFISLWYVFIKDWTASKGRNQTIKYIIGSIILAPLFLIVAVLKSFYKAVKDNEYRKTSKETHITALSIIIFVVSCGVFVSLFNNNLATFFNAVKEPFTFTTIKDVGVTKIWPNVLTTVAEFNPASLQDILNTASFGVGIILLFAFLGIGYLLFEREHLDKSQRLILAFTLVWVIGLTFITDKINSKLLYVVLLLIPLVYTFYKKTPLITAYFVWISVWFAGIIKFIPWFASRILFLFLIIGLPVAVGIIYSILAKKRIDLKYGLLLCIWFIGTIYASTKGVRFIMILVPAFSVAVGLGVAFIYKLWAEVINEQLHLKKIYAQSILIIMVGILLFVPIAVGYNTGYNQIPLINDQWYDALKKIDNEAAPDAIVNSWWDFGHWFKAIADRPVTFDGGSQDTPQAHWIGRVLLTDNEQEAVSILRMLDCGGSSAADLISNLTGNDYNSVKITKEIIMQTKENALQTLLDEGFTEEQASDIIQYTHCDPPENYFITSQDMVGKAGVWAHFGAWNFDKAHVVNIVNNYNKEEAIEKIQKDLDVSEEKASQLYTEAVLNDPNNWIAPWPSYISMPTNCWQGNVMLYCDSGININLTNGEVVVQTTGGDQYPKKFLFINPNGDVETKDFSDKPNLLISADGTSYSAAIIPVGTGYKGFIMDTNLLESMFTRMFFYEGHGLECFDLFDHKTTVTGEEIYVWKVDWECTDPNIIYKNSLSIE
ncbi:hypothetical protein COV16_00765 [Candidatus Woesearchaeota archaeon CG10_big_fil_rev_8_21_14_0_10_34_8]|nr:MAG: hypothetical protein COV16_00765 [Candidatus Woesearchaeota archaeon CG10_big_fil_rev_8_21_14_0_10_34_8]